MPRVPRYDGYVAKRPIEVSSPGPNAFGYARAQSLIRTGAGLQQLSADFNKMQEDEERIRAMEIETAAGEQVQKLLYDPETGYINKRGKNAMDAFDELDEQIKGIEDTLLEDASPGVRRRVHETLRKAGNAARVKSRNHRVREQRDYEIGLGETRIKNSVDDASLEALSEEDFNTALGIIRRTTVEESEKAGEDPTETARRVRENYTAATVGRIGALSRSGQLEAAIATRDRFYPSMTNEARDAAEKAIRAGQISYARQKFGSDPEGLEAALEAVEPEKTEGPIVNFKGRGANNAANRKHVGDTHRAVIAASPRADSATIAKFNEAYPLIPAGKYQRDGRVVIDQEFAGKLQRALEMMEREGVAIRFNAGSMIAGLEDRFKRGGRVPGVILNTPHFLGRAADIHLDGMTPALVAKIEAETGLKIITPDNYARRGAGFKHFDFSLVKNGSRYTPFVGAASTADPLLDGLPPETRNKLLSEARQGRKVADAEAYDALITGVYADIESGNIASVQDLDADTRQELGEKGLRAVASYLKGDVTTNETRFYELLEQARRSPTQFAKVKLSALKGEISKPDLEKLFRIQRSVMKSTGGGAGDLKFSTVMKDAEPFLLRAGIHKPTRTTKLESEKQIYYRAQAALFDMAAEYHQRTGKTPDTKTTREMAREVLRDVDTGLTGVGWLLGYDATELEIGMEIDDVPQVAQDQIRLRLARAGASLSDDDIIAIYLSTRAQQRIKARGGR